MHLDRRLDCVGHQMNGAREFGEAAARIAGLDTRDGGALGHSVLRRLGQHLKLGAERPDLGVLHRSMRIEHRHRLTSGVGESRSCAHAHGVIDGQHEEIVGGARRRGAVDERVRERQYQQHEERQSKRQQEQIAKPPVTDGTLRSALEEDQRAEWTRRGGMAAEQMQIDRDADRHDAAEEPGSQESHVSFVSFGPA